MIGLLVYWSISHDLLGAAICGELPELSETDVERSTGEPLLSAAEVIYNWDACHFKPSITGFYVQIMRTKYRL